MRGRPLVARGLGWARLVQGGPAEYALPVVHSALATHTVPFSEHLSPGLLVRELPRRPAAALRGMTLAIEISAYPEAWPVHLLRLRLAGEHRGQALHGLPLRAMAETG